MAGSSAIEFFSGDTSLLQRDVLPTAGDEGLSFLGVTFAEPIVTRVRIRAGDAAGGPNDVTQGGAQDIVVLDDFIYGEPQPVTADLAVSGVATQDPADVRTALAAHVAALRAVLQALGG